MRWGEEGGVEKGVTRRGVTYLLSLLLLLVRTVDFWHHRSSMYVWYDRQGISHACTCGGHDDDSDACTMCSGVGFSAKLSRVLYILYAHEVRCGGPANARVGGDAPLLVP